jgi:succinate dehydrogenase / fumarate reductase cytochrome b subunit
MINQSMDEETLSRAVNNNNATGNVRARTVDLPLLGIRLPASGVVSIVHRLTGVLLVILIPFLVYGLQVSLSGADGFREISRWADRVPVRIFLGIVILILAQHFFSGIRHLLLDLHVGMTRNASRRTAWASFAATAIVALVLCLGVGL